MRTVTLAVTFGLVFSLPALAAAKTINVSPGGSI